MSSSSLMFEDILDSCLAALQAHETTVEACLVRHPAETQELEPLLRLAVRLQAAHTLTASPEFHRVATGRMLGLIAQDKSQASRPALKRLDWRETWLRWLPGLHVSRKLAGAMASCLLVISLLLAGTGVIYGSENVLPGDGLYVVVTTVESLRLAASPTQAASAELHLEFSFRRWDEVMRLTQRKRLVQAEGAVNGYASQMAAAVAALGEDSHLSPEQRVRLARALLSWLNAHDTQFGALLQDTPPYLRSAAAAAAELSETARARALQVLEEGAPQPALATATPTPRARPTAVPDTGNQGQVGPAGPVSPDPSPARPPATAPATARSGAAWATPVPAGPAPHMQWPAGTPATMAAPPVLTAATTALPPALTAAARHVPPALTAVATHVPAALTAAATRLPAALTAAATRVPAALTAVATRVPAALTAIAPVLTSIGPAGPLVTPSIDLPPEWPPVQLPVQPPELPPWPQHRPLPGPPLEQQQMPELPWHS
jgi:hypothetical protein